MTTATADIEKVETVQNSDGGKKKRGRTRRPDHPLIGSEDVSLYPFASTPDDYDPKKHAPLAKNDFATEAAFFDYKADRAEQAALKWRTEATEARKFGSQRERASLRKLRAMREKAHEIERKLAAQGVDIESLLSDLDEDDDS